jgi:hypothetical protein
VGRTRRTIHEPGVGQTLVSQWFVGAGGPEQAPEMQGGDLWLDWQTGNLYLQYTHERPSHFAELLTALARIDQQRERLSQ